MPMAMPPHGMLPLSACMGGYMPHQMHLCGGGGGGGADMCPPPPRGSGAESPSEEAPLPQAVQRLFAAHAHDLRACAPVRSAAPPPSPAHREGPARAELKGTKETL